LARAGYYAIPPTQIIPFSPDDRKLGGELCQHGSPSTLPLSLQFDSFRAREGFYIVPLSFEIPPAAIQFIARAISNICNWKFLGLVRPEGEDKILSRLGGSFDVNLTALQYESI